MGKNQITPMGKIKELHSHSHACTVAHGGPFELYECDELYNKLTCLVISSFSKAHQQAFIHTVNWHGSACTGFTDGKTAILPEYKGEKIYDFGCDFIVPVRDQKLEDLLRHHNASWTEVQPNCPDALATVSTSPATKHYCGVNRMCAMIKGWPTIVDYIGTTPQGVRIGRIAYLGNDDCVYDINECTCPEAFAQTIKDDSYHCVPSEVVMNKEHNSLAISKDNFDLKNILSTHFRPFSVPNVDQCMPKTGNVLG